MSHVKRVDRMRIPKRVFNSIVNEGDLCSGTRQDINKIRKLARNWKTKVIERGQDEVDDNEEEEEWDIMKMIMNLRVT